VQVALAAAVNEPAANEPIAPSQVTPAVATLATSSEWRPLAESLPGLVRQLAMQCEQIERTDVLLRLCLPEGQKALLASVGDKLRAALAEKLGSAVKVEIDLVADVANYSRQSPAAERGRAKPNRPSTTIPSYKPWCANAMPPSPISAHAPRRRANPLKGDK
jgi:hypothetical protein